jgi:hypothetical protein
MGPPPVRRLVSLSRFVFVAALAGNLTSPQYAGAQGVPLPRLAETGPSKQVRYMLHWIRRVCPLTDPADTTLTPAQRRALVGAMNRFVLAPYRYQELKQIQETWLAVPAATVVDHRERGVQGSVAPHPTGNRERLAEREKEREIKREERSRRRINRLQEMWLCGDWRDIEDFPRRVVVDSLLKQVRVSPHAAPSQPMPTGDAIGYASIRRGDGSSLRVANPDTASLRRILALFEDTLILDRIGEGDSGEYVRRVKIADRAKPLNDDVEARLDSLSQAVRAVVIERKLRHRWWWPVHGREQARMYWRQPSLSTLDVGFVSGSSKQGAAFTEVISAFVHPIRVSLNVVLASSKSDSTTPSQGTTNAAPNPSPETVTRFLNGGGLVNLSLTAPLLQLPPSISDELQVVVLAHPRFGGTLPALGVTARDSTLIYDAGIEIHTSLNDVQGGAGLFFQLRGGYAGGTGNFLPLIGVDPKKKVFGYATANAGVVFFEQFMITVGRPLAGPDALTDIGWQLGLTLMRRSASDALRE